MNGTIPNTFMTDLHLRNMAPFWHFLTDYLCKAFEILAHLGTELFPFLGLCTWSLAWPRRGTLLLFLKWTKTEIVIKDKTLRVLVHGLIRNSYLGCSSMTRQTQGETIFSQSLRNETRGWLWFSFARRAYAYCMKSSHEFASLTAGWEQCIISSDQDCFFFCTVFFFHSISVCLSYLSQGLEGPQGPKVSYTKSTCLFFRSCKKGLTFLLILKLSPRCLFGVLPKEVISLEIFRYSLVATTKVSVYWKVINDNKVLHYLEFWGNMYFLADTFLKISIDTYL